MFDLPAIDVYPVTESPVSPYFCQVIFYPQPSRQQEPIASNEPDNKTTAPQAPVIISPAPNLHLSEETYAKLKIIIDENLKANKPYVNTGQFTPYEETKRKLDAVIRVIGQAVGRPADVDSIKPPQELAEGIIAYYDAKPGEREAKKPDAICVDISLLTNEILKQYLKADSSILIFHPIDKDGFEYVHGHAAAAILFDGWFVDPATQNEAVNFDKITLERGNPSYNSFHSAVKQKYSELPLFTYPNCVFIDFSKAKTEAEISAFYLLENAVRMKAPTGASEKDKENIQSDKDAMFMNAYLLDSGNYYLAIKAGDIFKDAGNIESARSAYLSAAANNPEMYIASAKTAWSLFELKENATSADLKIAYALINRAVDYAAKEGFSLLIADYYHSEISGKMGYDEESNEAHKKYEKESGGK